MSKFSRCLGGTSKRLLTSNIIHGVLSQKTEVFMISIRLPDHFMNDDQVGWSGIESGELYQISFINQTTMIWTLPILLTTKRICWVSLFFSFVSFMCDRLRGDEGCVFFSCRIFHFIPQKWEGGSCYKRLPRQMHIRISLIISCANKS